MNLLELKDISFGYTHEVIFQKVSMNLSEGQIFCLFGPNGCGKTTLLDCIIGFNRIQEGSINLLGMNMKHRGISETARIVSYVPQSHEKTFPYLVKEIVLMGRTAHNPGFSSPGRKDVEIAYQAIESMGIAHLAERKYTTLSGGETRLVMLARAMAQDSPLILMDEPASHLDMDHELMLLEMITRLIREKNKSIIFSSHSPNHAYYFENHGLDVSVGLMHDRNFLTTGKPMDVLNEENIKKLFNIDSMVYHADLNENKKIRFLVPLHTLGSKGAGKNNDTRK